MRLWRYKWWWRAAGSVVILVGMIATALYLRRPGLKIKSTSLLELMENWPSVTRNFTLLDPRPEASAWTQREAVSSFVLLLPDDVTIRYESGALAISIPGASVELWPETNGSTNVLREWRTWNELVRFRTKNVEEMRALPTDELRGYANMLGRRIAILSRDCDPYYYNGGESKFVAMREPTGNFVGWLWITDDAKGMYFKGASDSFASFRRSLAILLAAKEVRQEANR